MAALLVAGCGSSPSGGVANSPDGAGGSGESGPYTIVTTTGMVKDIVEHVAGDKARVIGIMGTGVFHQEQEIEDY